MAQTSIQVVLPEPLVEYVEQRVEYGEFSSASEFVQALLREHPYPRLGALEDELDAALSSGTVSDSRNDLLDGRLTVILKERRATNGTKRL